MIYTIMKVLEHKSLLAVMRTCRTLYELGVPLLLEDIHYTRTHASSTLYRGLLLADPTRFVHIRALRCDYMDFHLRPTVPRTHSLFTDFLRFATALHHLDIQFNFGTYIDYKVLAPIAELPELRRLHLRRCPQGPLVRLMSRLTAPLTELGIYENGFGRLEALRTDVFALAAPFRDSLTSLALVLPFTPPELVAPQPHAVTFPHMSSVVLHVERPPTAPTLAALFPSVTHLDVGCTSHRGPDLPNLAAQRQRALSEPQWAAGHTLQRVCGPAADVWGLELACGARELALTDTSAGPDEANPALAAAMIHAARPATLVVPLRAPCVVLNRGALSTFVHDGLRELRLSIEVCEGLLLHTVHVLVSTPPPFWIGHYGVG